MIQKLFIRCVLEKMRTIQTVARFSRMKSLNDLKPKGYEIQTLYPTLERQSKNFKETKVFIY